MNRLAIKTAVQKHIVRSLFLLAICSLFLSGCGRNTDTDANAQSLSDQTISETDSNTEGFREEETDVQAASLLKQMTDAIELQFPGQTFSEVPSGELAISPLLFGGAYLYSARVSSEGFRYVAGVRSTEENPLEEMSCGSGDSISGFNMSQFDEGRLLLFEESGDEESGLWYLYDYLQRGASGIRYMMERGEAGVTLVPPAKNPFLKVSMVKEGYPVTEYLPLSDDQAKQLNSGSPASQDPGSSGRIALCESREELPKVWNNSEIIPTEEMAALAAEKCGFDSYHISDIGDVTKAVLTLPLSGEEREETLQNKEDLDKLVGLLEKGAYGETRYDRDYSGLMELTRADGSVMTVQLAAENGGFMLGNSVTCELSAEVTQELWSLFTMIDGWKRFGNEIQMEMDAVSFTEDSPELLFTLLNYTGKAINYSLSPVIYKRSENHLSGETWERIDSVLGVCGTFTPMEEERVSLSVPWKDAYELKGPGLYRLEIQVIPEKDVRFGVSAEFEMR